MNRTSPPILTTPLAWATSVAFLLAIFQTAIAAPQTPAPQAESVAESAALPERTEPPSQTEPPAQPALPEPPDAVAKLIADGDVTYYFFNPKREKFDFAGETTFNFRYHYRCRTRYEIIDRTADDITATVDRPRTIPATDGAEDTEGLEGSRALRVSVTYDDVVLTIDHRMRLPEYVIGDKFFEHPLVRHEFDHVAISADPRLQTHLLRMLQRRNSVLIVPVPDSLTDREALLAAANDAARRASKIVFDDFVAEIKIRYQELDSITKHGIRPLPPADRDRLIAPF